MSNIEDRIKAAGLELPESPKPVAVYIPAIRSGNLVFTSGQLPMVEGKLTVEGLAGRDVDKEAAAKGAEICALNALAAVKGVIGDLDKIKRVVKLVVYVASTPEFTGQPSVANGASRLMETVFGEDGRHARSAVGVPCLPLNATVELEMIVEV